MLNKTQPLYSESEISKAFKMNADELSRWSAHRRVNFTVIDGKRYFSEDQLKAALLEIGKLGPGAERQDYGFVRHPRRLKSMAKAIEENLIGTWVDISDNKKAVITYFKDKTFSGDWPSESLGIANGPQLINASGTWSVEKQDKATKNSNQPTSTKAGLPWFSLSFFPRGQLFQVQE